MRARCPTLLCFFPCIRAFFTQKTVLQAECQQTLAAGKLDAELFQFAVEVGTFEANFLCDAAHVLAFLRDVAR